MDVRCNLADLLRTQQGKAGCSSATRLYTEVLRDCATCAGAWRGLGDVCREAKDALRALPFYQVRGIGWKGGRGVRGGTEGRA